MKELHIDIETYSPAELSRCGVYRYAEADDFRVLLFGWSEDGGPVHVADLESGGRVPADVLDALSDPKIIKYAHNAVFERICLSRMLGMKPGEYLSPKGWHCTMIWAATLGLPLSLASVGEVLGLEKQKMAEGKDLISLFCVPNKRKFQPSLIAQAERILPADEPEKWKTFIEYNRRDVETEMEIAQRLSRFPVPTSIWAEYTIDQEINDRGVLLDMDLAESALRLNERSTEELTDRLKELTGLANPGSVSQMKNWLSDHGYETDTLGKAAVRGMLADAEDPTLKEVLELRMKLAKSSTSKYKTMTECVCRDGRARGMFQFYGSRTGRWAGRLLQMQNLPQNHLEDLDTARALVKSEDYESLEMLYEDIPDTLSQLIRTAFVAPEGKRFIVADFSAIEARVIAWLAGEEWRMKTFAEGGDIYCASASQMFKVPVVKHGINGHLRAKGKIAELALGYGGGAGALKAMGALNMGLTEEELPGLVTQWRDANPMITKFWWDVDNAAMQAVRYPGRNQVLCRKVFDPERARENEYLMHAREGSFSNYFNGDEILSFRLEKSVLFITLPSGRKIAYCRPRIMPNKFGGDCISFESVTTGRKWGRVDTYGPKLVENIIQATARDLLMNAMSRLKHAGIVMHIHDEVVCEAGQEWTLDQVCQLMAEAPEWAGGLILRADGYETPYYKKD